MIYTTSPKGIALIKQFEGCKLAAYPDPESGDKPWTLGYGHTRGVFKGMTCTQAQADKWLVEDLGYFEKQVNMMVKVPLSQNQFDALVCICYNIGPTRLSTSTLLKRLNHYNYKEAQNQFIAWDAPNNPAVTKGLLRRRQAEAQLFGEDDDGKA